MFAFHLISDFRTVVSLGSALFTINSTFGFVSGPMVSSDLHVVFKHRKLKMNTTNLHYDPHAGLGLGCKSS